MAAELTAETARRLLGVDGSAGPDELRAAFRRALRRTHPDLHGGDGAEARRVLVAYELLTGDQPEPEVPPEPEPEPERVPVAGAAVAVDGDTISAELPAGDLFEILVAAAEEVGEITYLDADAGLLEVLVRITGHGPCSVVLTLQGRGPGGEHSVTEASCTVEPLGSGPAPSPEVVAAVLADGFRAVTDR